MICDKQNCYKILRVFYGWWYTKPYKDAYFPEIKKMMNCATYDIDSGYLNLNNVKY